MDIRYGVTTMKKNKKNDKKRNALLSERQKRKRQKIKRKGTDVKNTDCPFSYLYTFKFYLSAASAAS